MWSKCEKFENRGPGGGFFGKKTLPPNGRAAPAPTDVITNPLTGRKSKRGYPNYSFTEILLNDVNRFIAHTFIQEEEGKIVSEDDLNSFLAH